MNRFYYEAPQLEILQILLEKGFAMISILKGAKEIPNSLSLTLQICMIMKKIYAKAVMAAFIGMIAAAGVSCSSDEEAPVPATDAGGLTEISLEVPPPAGSRTTLNATDLIKWNAADRTKVGLWYSYSNMTSEGTYSSHVAMASSSIELSESNKSAKFGFSSSNAIDAIYYAFYPYTSSFSRYSLPLTVANEQTQAAAGETTFGSASVPMISDKLELNSQVTVDAQEARILTNMHVLSSIIAFYVYDSAGSAEEVKSIDITSTNGKYLAGDTKIDATALTDQIPALTGTTSTVSVSLTNFFSLQGVTAKEQSAPIYLSVVPNEGVEGKIRVTTDLAVYIFPFSAPKTFPRAEMKDMLLNLSSSKAERIAFADMVTPLINLTMLERTASGSYNNTVLTIKKGNDAVAGFYALTTPKLSANLTRAEVLAGDIYHFGDADNDLFKLQADGSVKYYKRVNLYSPSQFSFGVIPFDEYGNYGELKGDSGYGNSTRTTTLNL